MTEQVYSESGIPIKDLYTPQDVSKLDYERDLGAPGKPPYTRGVYPTMYRGQLWTIRRLSGANTPEETNKLYREEYELGQSGFSVAPDISTVVGMDADDPRITADIGHAGVPMSSIEDVEATFDGLPIDKVSTYIADRCGAVNTAMYFVMAQRKGIDLKQIRGTTANDMLAWSVPSLINQPPPEAYLRYAVDFIEWCCENAPRWNPVSFDSYNARDCGITAVQELGMLMATAIQYTDEAKRRGRVPLDVFVRRFSFNTGLHNDLFEEIAKLRAARRMWYKIIHDRYGIDDPRAGLFRVHGQSSGSTHTTQEPLNNLIRIAYQVLAGVLGGAQSIHANGYDEGICLPTDQSMLLSIRTEQIVGLETNVTNTIDPLGGSYYVESLTNELEDRAWDYIKKIESMGGMAAAMKSGWAYNEYRDGMINHEKRLASGETTVVGVNKFRLAKEPYEVPIFRWDAGAPDRQIEKLKRFKQSRDKAKLEQALGALEETTRRGENVYPAVLEAVRCNATLGEISQVQTKVYGVWQRPLGV